MMLNHQKGIHLSRDTLQSDRRRVYLGALASPPAF